MYRCTIKDKMSSPFPSPHAPTPPHSYPQWRGVWYWSSQLVAIVESYNPLLTLIAPPPGQQFAKGLISLRVAGFPEDFFSSAPWALRAQSRCLLA